MDSMTIWRKRYENDRKNSFSFIVWDMPYTLGLHKNFRVFVSLCFQDILYSG